MKIINTFYPANPSDTSVTITASSNDAVFVADNLKNLQPIKSWKSTAVTEQYVKYDFGTNVTLDSLFINRINFAGFSVYVNVADDVDIGDWTLIETVAGLTIDEIADEEFIHRWVELSGTFRYLKIVIPTQTPLFETSYFKIGNMLVGNAVEVWNPKSGFAISYLPKRAITEFRSGYISVEKLGRTRRAFSGALDKIKQSEMVKMSLTFEPFILYLDYTSDDTKCYIVRAVKEFVRSYQMADVLSMPFSCEEIV